jgi:isopentenyldiphosphate isomerase
MLNGRQMAMVTPAAAHPENSPDETVEVVDVLGTVLRLVTRRQMRAETLWHRAVFIVVRSSSGDVLVHRRAETKDVWPGWWDVAVGGVVSPGESWEVAAQRELAEELGVSGVLRPMGTGAYADGDVKLVAACFEVVCDGPFAFSDGEITTTQWVTPGDLRARIGQDSFLPDSIALILPRIGL